MSNATDSSHLNGCRALLDGMRVFFEGVEEVFEFNKTRAALWSGQATVLKETLDEYWLKSYELRDGLLLFAEVMDLTFEEIAESNNDWLNRVPDLESAWLKTMESDVTSAIGEIYDVVSWLPLFPSPPFEIQRPSTEKLAALNAHLASIRNRCETIQKWYTEIVGDDGANLGHPSGTEDDQEPSTRPQIEGLDLESQALAALTQHPEWTDTKIAELIGANRTSLYRWDRFKAAKKALARGGGNIPNGSKYGDVEGIQPDE